MTKTQIYLPEDHLKILRELAERTGRSVADLVREAIAKVWLRPEARGPVALWSGTTKRSSLEHDSIYDWARRKPGIWKGRVWISKDFDSTLPSKIVKVFRGE